MHAGAWLFVVGMHACILQYFFLAQHGQANPLTSRPCTRVVLPQAEEAPDERWAVLVNEFGALGIDGALLEGSSAGAGAGFGRCCGRNWCHSGAMPCHALQCAAFLASGSTLLHASISNGPFVLITHDVDWQCRSGIKGRVVGLAGCGLGTARAATGCGADAVWRTPLFISVFNLYMHVLQVSEALSFAS